MEIKLSKEKVGRKVERTKGKVRREVSSLSRGVLREEGEAGPETAARDYSRL
jgi:hypothetical protein